jgi:hypothetical protein
MIETLDGEAPQVKINLNDATDITCNNCGDRRFEPVYLMKRLSKLVSPTGRDEIIPLGPPIIPPIFACYMCGHINDEFLPGPLKGTKPSGQTQSATGVISSDLDSVGQTGPQKPSITLVK